jgi:hypothetical protein
MVTKPQGERHCYVGDYQLDEITLDEARHGPATSR